MHLERVGIRRLACAVAVAGGAAVALGLVGGCRGGWTSREREDALHDCLASTGDVWDPDIQDPFEFKRVYCACVVSELAAAVPHATLGDGRALREVNEVLDGIGPRCAERGKAARR